MDLPVPGLTKLTGWLGGRHPLPLWMRYPHGSKLRKAFRPQPNLYLPASRYPPEACRTHRSQPFTNRTSAVWPESPPCDSNSKVTCPAVIEALALYRPVSTMCG